MKKSLMAVLAGSIIGMTGPVVAQDTGRVTGETIVTTDTVVVTSPVIVTHRVVLLPEMLAQPRNFDKEVRHQSGGVGGAIGGYYINGTTRADNRPLPGSTWPYR